MEIPLGKFIKSGDIFGNTFHPGMDGKCKPETVHGNPVTNEASLYVQSYDLFMTFNVLAEAVHLESLKFTVDQ